MSLSNGWELNFFQSGPLTEEIFCFRLPSMYARVTTVAILLALPIGYSYYRFFHFEQSLNTTIVNPAISGPEATDLIRRVKHFDAVEWKEGPTVVRVTDTSALSMFGWVRRGDVVFLYPQSDRAVVFDPLVERVMNIVFVKLKPIHEKQ